MSTARVSSFNVVVSILVSANAFTSPAWAQPKPDGEGFNAYILKAHEKLMNERWGLGYDEHAYFTRDLNYGKQSKAIQAHKDKKPATMCNAAVTETFIEAINLYSQDNPNWNAEKAVPSSSFDKSNWNNLRPHLFSHDYLEYEPFKGRHAEFPSELMKKFEKFHSKQGMALALEKFGIGRQILFSDLQPGDVVTFSRSFIKYDGSPAGAGHSAIFLGYLGRDQKVVNVYDPKKVVGFKYFSSQGSWFDPKERKGLGERWAYFSGFCPFKPGYQIPRGTKEKMGKGCADAVDKPSNKQRFPVVIEGRPRDCCLTASGMYAPRLGRIFTPSLWKYREAQERLARLHEGLRRELEDYLKSRERSRRVVALIAKGAIDLNRRKPKDVERFYADVKSKTQFDMTKINESISSISISLEAARKIQKLTPQSIIAAANAGITASERSLMEVEIQSATKAVLLKLDETDPVPNAALDGESVD